MSAVRAHAVRSPRMVAVGARLDLDESQREVGPASALLRFGELDLREGHGPRNFTGTGWSAVRGLVGGLLVGRLVRLQRLHTPPHGCERAAEMRLELFQLLQGVRLGVADDLVALALRVFHDLRSVALGAAQDLVFGSCLLGALVGSRHRPRGLGVRLGHDPLLLGDGPVGLLDLVRKIEADLVDQLHQLVLVEHDLRRQRDVSSVLDQVLETVKQLVDLYLNFSFNALATGGGTRSETLPPYRAMSFKILDETKMCAKPDIRKTVWMSGASLRFISACCSSASKSE